MRNLFTALFIHIFVSGFAQINTDKVMINARNALYFEDYVLSIQYFNQIIRVKPHMAEPYFFRAIAKLSLDDYQGAEDDCALAIERNPYIVNAYMVRGIARQNNGNFEGAIKDYQKGLSYSPENRTFLSNIAVCNTAVKNYTEAEKDYDRLVKIHPSFAIGFLARGNMYLETKDTTKAIQNIDKAIELDKFNARAYALRAMLKYETKSYNDALANMDEAIRLEPGTAQFIINRAIIRFQLNDLRGAMADYDRAITLEQNNLVALYNRGLLRMQVGDNNRAVDDFTKVLRLEPDNYFAYYNRAILNEEIGRVMDAVDDITVVIKQYPQFVPAYYFRSDLKKKLNDRHGAEKDYWTALNIEKEYRENKAKAATGDSTAMAAVNQTKEEESNTREKSDKNIDKFNKLLMADKETTSTKSQYQNQELRGRVQDKSVSIDLEPMFVLTYYERGEKIDNTVLYYKELVEFNRKGWLNRYLLMTNDQASLTEDQIEYHFNSINDYSKQIDSNIKNEKALFGRSIDFMLVNDFNSAIEDLNHLTNFNPTLGWAYFNRAVLRYRQIELERSTTDKNQATTKSATTLNLSSALNRQGRSQQALQPVKESKAEYDAVMRDLNTAIELTPDNYYAYYNRANLRCAQQDYRMAVVDYTEAIRFEPDFAEAYYNRGLVFSYLGEIEKGISDLSKAGEMGIVGAYNVIKRLSE